jgi:cell wall-associated NlpC family hydrolase
MPGQSTPTTTPTTTAGVSTDPLVAKINQRRADIAALGDQLIKLGQDRDLANQQVATADQKVSAATTAVTSAQQAATVAAAGALQDAAALPPGTIGSGLQDLDALAAIQRGDSSGQDAAARQLAIAQAAQQSALSEQSTATASATSLATQYDALNAQIAGKQAELQKWEQQSAAALAAAEASQSATDAQLGAQYLSGVPNGQGADPRAVAALQFALAQRGDWYVWSTEGPDTYDCSGLMYAAYHSVAAGNYPLMRVSRDQYSQTDKKTVDRYSLLPGDLLFFSSTSSWEQIHHVAMYAGNGMMVEAPRTGLKVRLVPVRWSSLFAATRVYGPVDGGQTSVPTSGGSSSGGSSSGGSSSGGSSSGGSSSGGSSSTPTHTPSPTTKPTKPTKPPTSPPTSKPTTTPPTTKPTTTPPTSKPTTTPPTTEPPSPTADPTTSPAGSGDGSSGGSDPSSESAAASSSSSESGSSSASD